MQRARWKRRLTYALGVAAIVIVLYFGARGFFSGQASRWIAMLKNPNPATRRQGAIYLNEFAPRTDEIYHAFRTAMLDESPGVRQQAAYVLGEFQTFSDDVIPLLKAALNDEDFMVRQNAAKSLHKLGDR